MEQVSREALLGAPDSQPPSLEKERVNTAMVFSCSLFVPSASASGHLETQALGVCKGRTGLVTSSYPYSLTRWPVQDTTMVEQLVARLGLKDVGRSQGEPLMSQAWNSLSIPDCHACPVSVGP